MRIISWIAQTLFIRSWLILGGIAIGVLARFLWPIEFNDSAVTLPKAVEKYRELVEKYPNDPKTLQQQLQIEERLNQPSLDDLGNVPLSR